MDIQTCTLFDLMRSRSVNLEACAPSFFFHTDGITRLREVFLSTALEILSAEPETRILWVTPTDSSADPPGYHALLQALCSTGRFRVVSGAEIHAELDQLLLRETNSPSSLPHLCIFAKDADHCIPPNALRLLTKLLETDSGRKLRVFVSIKRPDPLPASHLLHPFPYLPQVFPFRMCRNALYVHDGRATLLVPSGDVCIMARKFLKEEAARNREKKREARKARKHTPIQIILAVTAALLAFIAARSGG